MYTDTILDLIYFEYKGQVFVSFYIFKSVNCNSDYKEAMNIGGIFRRQHQQVPVLDDLSKPTFVEPTHAAGSAGGKALRKALRQPGGTSARYNPCSRPPLSDEDKKRIIKTRANMGFGELVQELKQRGVERGVKFAWKLIIGQTGGWNGLKEKKGHKPLIIDLLEQWDQEESNAEEANVPATQAEASAPPSDSLPEDHEAANIVAEICSLNCI